MILISEETVTIRYTVKFEKRVTERQQNNETRQDFIDRIADDLFKQPNDYTRQHNCESKIARPTMLETPLKLALVAIVQVPTILLGFKAKQSKHYFLYFAIPVLK